MRICLGFDFAETAQAPIGESDIKSGVTQP
jgi:hypothetical protein